MSLLRILRNLAVLVILTVGGLSLMPHPMEAQSSCGLGAHCTSNNQCCWCQCTVHETCCLWPRQACQYNWQCCTNFCQAWPGGGKACS
jgi:hypothetical protein